MVDDAYDAWFEYLDTAKEAGQINCVHDAQTIIRIGFKLSADDGKAVAYRWMAYDTASKLTWKPKGSHGEVSDGRLNDHYTVFKIVWATDSELNPYVLYTKLPGIKTHLGRFHGEGAAKERAVKALTQWLYRAGLAGL